MPRWILALLVIASLTGCNRAAETANNGVISQVSPPPPPVDTCAPRVEAWRVALADYRRQEDSRRATCSDLNERQISLNDQYRALRSEWAFTAPQYERCLRMEGQSEMRTCLQGLCEFISLGGYNCRDLIDPLLRISDGQDAVFAQARTNCCSMEVASTQYSLLGLSQPQATCQPTSPPPAPACAGISPEPGLSSANMAH